MGAGAAMRSPLHALLLAALLAAALQAARAKKCTAANNVCVSKRWVMQGLEASRRGAPGLSAPANVGMAWGPGACWGRHALLDDRGSANAHRKYRRIGDPAPLDVQDAGVPPT